jgi:hypothetical protein
VTWENRPEAFAWRLWIQSEADGHEVELARADAVPPAGLPLAAIERAMLAVAGRHRLVLEATTAGGLTARAESWFTAGELHYTLIPLQSGQFAEPVYSTYDTDSSGRWIIYSGGNAYPKKVAILDRVAGRKGMLRPHAGHNEIVLSGDGSRLFFSGSFEEGASWRGGLGYLETATGAVKRLTSSRMNQRTVSRDGRRMAYQKRVSSAIHDIQYFVLDEATGEERQITDDPYAINWSTVPSACPRARGQTPLISADGEQIVIVSSGRLAGGPEDPSVGCRVFRYHVSSGEIEEVAHFPVEHMLGGAITLSDDARWLSFVVTRAVPEGVRVFPALLDMSTGEVFDPIADLGGFVAFDSVVTGDGRSVVISSQADLDPRVGNSDHNFELFLFDREEGTFTQITETLGGVDRSPSGCAPYLPRVSGDGGVVVFVFRQGGSESCPKPRPQRVETHGLTFRFARAVRKRPGNTGPVLDPLPERVEVPVGAELALEVRATDADGDPITLFAQVPGTANLPRTFEIEDHEDGTGSLRWKPRAHDAGIRTLRIAAFDEGGGETWHDVELVVSPSASDGCTGDCDADGEVTVAELVSLVSKSIDAPTLVGCPASGAGSSWSEYLADALHHALAGCPP